MNVEQSKWMGPAPKHCDTCSASIQRTFYDAKTNLGGSWANMCPTCWAFGPGINRIGPGLGQRYDRQPDGSYLKTGG